MQNRFKSWALWTSIAALAVFCVKEFAGIDISETVDGLLNVLLPVLVGFGIINNPAVRQTDCRGFCRAGATTYFGFGVEAVDMV